MNNRKQIASKFLTNTGSMVKAIEPINNGLINSTFKVQDEENNFFILQKINSSVFKYPFDLAHNLLILKENIELHCVKLIIPDYLSFKNKLIIEHESTFWRMYRYIPGIVFDKSKNNTMSKSAAMAMGRFHNLSEYMPLKKFRNPIENFTNFKFRLSELRRALKEGFDSRISETKYFHSELINHIGIIEDYCDVEKNVPKRLIHGDPKISNFIFDHRGENIIAIIDLDTIGQGSILYDFGDMVRSFANRNLESLQNDTNILNQQALQSIIDGYLVSTDGFLTKLERDSLLLSAKAVSLVQCIRFYTDYLMGDVYYNTINNDQNMSRAKNQFQLFCELNDLNLKF